MTLDDINFSPAAEAKLRAWAAAAGTDVPTVVREIVETSLSDDDDVDPADLEAVREGLEQADRGQGLTMDEVREHFRRRGIDIG